VRALVHEAWAHRDDGIREDAEVRARAGVVDRVLWREKRRLILRHEVRGEVTAGGEAPDADLCVRNVELLCFGSHQADGAQAVEHLSGIAIGSHAIVQNKGGNAMRLKPERDGLAFWRSEVVITAAGDDENSGGGGICGGEIDVDRGLIFSSGSVRERRGRRPQWDGALLGCGQRTMEDDP